MKAALFFLPEKVELFDLRQIFPAAFGAESPRDPAKQAMSANQNPPPENGVVAHACSGGSDAGGLADRIATGVAAAKQILSPEPNENKNTP